MEASSLAALERPRGAAAAASNTVNGGFFSSLLGIHFNSFHSYCLVMFQGFSCLNFGY